MHSFVRRLAVTAALGGLLLLSGRSMAQSSTIVNIPTSLQGLYSLDMVNAVSSSPIGNTNKADEADNILLYVSPYGDLCTRNASSSTVQILSSTPVLQGGPFGVVTWEVAASGLRFSLPLSDTTFSGFELASVSGTLFGRLTGSAPQLDTGSCESPPLNTGLVNTLFAQAEAVFPVLFPGSAFSFNQIGSGFDVFRYYQGSDTYLAVRDERVYARGGDFGEEFVEVGTLKDLLADINTMRVPNRLASFFQGTFSLSLGETRPFSPVPEGTQLTFVITATGQLCVGELQLSFPQVAGTTATWNNTNGNLRYTLDLTRDDDPTTFEANFAEGEFTLQSLGGSTYGVFTGEKTSLATECGDAKGSDPDQSSISSLFALIEQQYPAVFPAGPQTYTQKQDGFTYRYYFESQVFVAVKNGTVYLNGGEFGTNAAPVPFGSLSAVLAQLNNTPVAATIPSSSAGTYAMSFSGASTFSRFADGLAATVVLDAQGGLCLDGVALGSATARTSSPGTAFWENSDTGLSIRLDTSTLTSTTMSLQVSSLSGLSFSTLAGTRTSLATGCGANAVATDIALANQLFSLAEQHYAALFPASLLSFNQLEGNTVRRFYPATGMTLSITGDAVSVKGGRMAVPWCR